MKNENLKERTKRFALNIITLVETLPNNRTCNILGGQLLRAGTSVGANYRAAGRAKSQADFISKMGTVEEEADESGYWLDLLVAAKKLSADEASAHIQESNELTAIAVASIRTAKSSAAGRTPMKGSSPIPHSALRTPHSP